MEKQRNEQNRVATSFANRRTFSLNDFEIELFIPVTRRDGVILRRPIVKSEASLMDLKVSWSTPFNGPWSA